MAELGVGVVVANLVYKRASIGIFKQRGRDQQGGLQGEEKEEGIEAIEEGHEGELAWKLANVSMHVYI